MHDKGSNKKWYWIFALSMLAVSAGCNKQAQESSTTALQVPLGSDRLFSFESVNRGARLYQEHCAQCHGPEAQGHPDWQNPQVVAAPPLNGTGNEWKRKKSELAGVIKFGIKRGTEPVMPGWDGRLSDQEIDDVIAWFQALWPMDVYDQWLKVNAGEAPAPEKKPEKKG